MAAMAQITEAQPELRLDDANGACLATQGSIIPHKAVGLCSNGENTLEYIYDVWYSMIMGSQALLFSALTAMAFRRELMVSFTHPAASRLSCQFGS